MCSPIKIRSFGGAFYVIMFINDHSRKMWAYTLKSKNQVLDIFKQLQVLVERQTGKKLKCVSVPTMEKSILDYLILIVESKVLDIKRCHLRYLN